MTWTSKTKTIAIADNKGWPISKPNVVGRAPTASHIGFGPYALYLAAARASHLNYASPAIAAPEFDMLRRLVEPHVDDTASDFAIEPSAASFKDFVGTYFTGTVAAGVALLVMAAEGYQVFAHFEALGGGSPGSGSAPDFAAFGLTRGVALVEAKGSASSKKVFNQALRKGYKKQVEPHLGHLIGGVAPSHGYCVGSWLRTGKPAATRIFYTQPPAGSAGSPPAADPGARLRMLRQNYASAFALAHGEDLARAIGESAADTPGPLFSRFRWRGRDWLTAPAPFGTWRFIVAEKEHHMALQFVPAGLDEGVQRLVFAIDVRAADIALRAFLDQESVQDPGPFDALLQDRRETKDGAAGVEQYGDGAVLPDGLALIDLSDNARDFSFTQWDPRARLLTPAPPEPSGD